MRAVQRRPSELTPRPRERHVLSRAGDRIADDQRPQRADDLSAALWNGTLNSNKVFLEAYEDMLWLARQRRLAGQPFLSEVAAGYADATERQKSLGAWNAELRKRRRSIATSNPGHAHLGDPYPASHAFSFRQDLAPGVTQTKHFIHPAARCAAGTSAYGTIIVTGR